MNRTGSYLIALSLAALLVSCGTAEDREVRRIVSGMSIEDRIGEMILLEFGQISYLDPNYEYKALCAMEESQLDGIIRDFNLQDRYDAKALKEAFNPSDLATVYPFFLLSMDISKNFEPDVDIAKAENLFGKMKTGGMLNMIGGDQASPAHTWRRVMHKLDSVSWEFAGKPCVYGLDEIHGTTYISDGTLFPSPVNMGASFNKELAAAMGDISSYENRAANIRWIYGPVLDIAVRPTWSRLYETFGEDPYLSAVLGAEYVKHMQDGRDTKVATCLKHYFAYSAPDNGIDRNPANLSISELKEKHFYPFKKAIEAGAWSVMTNSSIVNGESGVANYTFLTEWLKKGMNWDGVIVTDWADVNAMVTSQHTAADVDEAIEKVLKAGVDMIMVPSTLDYFDRIVSLVEQKRISKSRIADACTRIVRMKYRLGLYERNYPDPADYPLFGSEEFAAKSRQAALESEVLLKNNNCILPIPEGKRILVCGPNANSMRTLHGGWSYTWQGSNAEHFTEKYNTILEALQNRFGKANVDYEACVEYDMNADWDVEKPADFGKLAAKASTADYIIVCIGENSYAETRGSINDANLSAQQKELVRQAAKTGKPVILVLNEGRPRLISDIEPLADAVIDVMLPGIYGGDALASLISGDCNFSGKLPFSYPLHPNSFTNYFYKTCESRSTIPGIYNYSAHTDIQWWFGEGLSYTTFEYSDFSLDKTEFKSSDDLNFSVKITNTGKVAGKETAMVFVSDVAASIIPDNRRLRAFEKVELGAGESKIVNFTIPAKELSFADREGRMTLEKGEFIAMCGGLYITFNALENWSE